MLRETGELDIEIREIGFQIDALRSGMQEKYQADLDTLASGVREARGGPDRGAEGRAGQEEKGRRGVRRGEPAGHQRARGTADAARFSHRARSTTSIRLSTLSRKRSRGSTRYRRNASPRPSMPSTPASSPFSPSSSAAGRRRSFSPTAKTCWKPVSISRSSCPASGPRASICCPAARSRFPPWRSSSRSCCTSRLPS